MSKLTYQAFVFSGRGASPAAAVQQAMAAYAAWLTAQRGPSTETVQGWPLYEFAVYEDQAGRPLVTVCPPLLHDDPAAPYGCTLGIVAAMRLPAYPVEGD